MKWFLMSVKCVLILLTTIRVVHYSYYGFGVSRPHYR